MLNFQESSDLVPSKIREPIDSDQPDICRECGGVAIQSFGSLDLESTFENPEYCLCENCSWEWGMRSREGSRDVA